MKKGNRFAAKMSGRDTTAKTVFVVVVGVVILLFIVVAFVKTVLLVVAVVVVAVKVVLLVVAVTVVFVAVVVVAVVVVVFVVVVVSFIDDEYKATVKRSLLTLFFRVHCRCKAPECRRRIRRHRCRRRRGGNFHFCQVNNRQREKCLARRMALKTAKKNDSSWLFWPFKAKPLWSGTNKNRDVSTSPFARSLTPLTNSLAPDCSLRSRPPLRSLARSLAHFAHSLARGKVN